MSLKKIQSRADVSPVTNQAPPLARYAEEVNRVLFAIADAVNTTLDLEDLYGTIHQSLGQIIDVTNFFIAIVDQENRTLFFPYYADTVDDDFSPIADFDTGSSLTGLVVLEKRPLLLYTQELQNRAAENGIWGPVPLIWMGVPLVIRDNVIGVIAVQSYTNPNIYTKADLDLLEAVSHQTAIAIDRKRSIDELRRSEERASFALLATGSAIWEWNIQSGEVFFDDNHYLIAGYSPGEFVASRKEWQSRVHPDDIDRVSALLERCGSGSSDIYHAEYRYRRKNGEWMWILSQGRVFEKDGNKKPVRLTGTHSDISIQKHAEEKLRRSEETYRNIFLNAQIGLFKVELTKGILTECNDSLARMLGYHNREDCLHNFTMGHILPSSKTYRDAIRKLLRHGELINEETRFKRKDGSKAWFRYSLKFFRKDDHVEGVVEDITDFKAAQREKNRLQDKLNRSRKMEALGLLAGSVAHDLNNILSGIISYPELMLFKLEEGSELEQPLKAIQDSGQRAATVVNDLLAIARSAASKKEIHNLESLVIDYLKSPECQQFKSLYPDLTIKADLHCTKPSIFCSSVHVKKCIMNLIINGIEAIDGRGTLVVATGNLPMQDGDFKDEVNGRVWLSVTDSGPGIKKEDIEHIFEPFYTNKVMGKSGTGLGLTVVWNTMEDHKGEVKVESSAAGTTFRLYFPGVEGESPERKTSFDTHQVMGNGEMILVVDDEPQLRDIASQMLVSLGYTTRVVESGEAAIEYIRKDQVDLIVLDMLMEPGMSGRETYEEITKLIPHQKAIIVSGFSESNDVELALQCGVGAFLKKPYSLQQLGLAVKEVLEKKHVTLKK